MRDLDPLRDWEVQIYVNLWSKTHNISKQLMWIKAIFHCKQFFFLLLEHTCLQAFVSQQLPTCTNPLCVVIFVLFPLLLEFLLYPLKGSECRKFIDKINYFKMFELLSFQCDSHFLMIDWLIVVTLDLEALTWEGLEVLEALMIALVLHQLCEGSHQVIKINNDIVQ